MIHTIDALPYPDFADCIHKIEVWDINISLKSQEVALVTCSRIKNPDGSMKARTDTDTPFIPLTTKPNAPGDADYVAEHLDSSIEGGSTPYPSALISRMGSLTVPTVQLPISVVRPASSYRQVNTAVKIREKPTRWPKQNTAR